MKQITINFDAKEFDSYDSTREFMMARVHQLTKNGLKYPHKAIASDMDMGQSQLTKKLAHTDGARFTVDNLDLYLERTGDVQPIYFLLEKHVTGKKNKEALLKLKAEIEAQLQDA